MSLREKILKMQMKRNESQKKLDNDRLGVRKLQSVGQLNELRHARNKSVQYKVHGVSNGF